jgi:hypothetical protein
MYVGTYVYCEVGVSDLEANGELCVSWQIMCVRGNLLGLN